MDKESSGISVVRADIADTSGGAGIVDSSIGSDAVDIVYNSPGRHAVDYSRGTDTVGLSHGTGKVECSDSVIAETTRYGYTVGREVICADSSFDTADPPPVKQCCDTYTQVDIQAYS